MLVNHVKRFFKSFFVIMLSLVLVTTMTPGIAFASGTAGGGGGGGGAGAGGKFGWVHHAVDGRPLSQYSLDNPPDWNNFGYLSGPKYIVNVPGGGRSFGEQWFNANVFGYDCLYAAYVGYLRQGIPGHPHLGWVSIFGNNNPDTRGNWAPSGWNLADFFIRENGRLDSACQVSHAVVPGYCYKRKAGDWLTAIWYGVHNLDNHNPLTPQVSPSAAPSVSNSDYETRTVIIKTEGSDSGNYDRSGASAETKWGFPQSWEYDGKTLPHELNHNRNVVVTTQQITKIIERITHTEYDDEGNVTGTWVEVLPPRYEAGSTSRLSHFINYSGDPAPVLQTKFRPANLNRNTTDGNADTYAKQGDGDLDSSFATSDKLLQITVNNNRGITDGSALPALDLNNDFDFRVDYKDNAGTFGLPYNNTSEGNSGPSGKYQWYTNDQSSSRLSGGYANTNFSRGYANDWRGDLTDTGISSWGVGYYRFNLGLNESISQSSIGAGKFSSLAKDYGEELLDNESFSFVADHTNKASGTYTTRFISTGKYTTDNESTWNGADSFKKWWIDTYTQSRYYEYGVQWHGYASISGVDAPNLAGPLASCSHQPTRNAGGNSTYFSSDGVSQRGLYVGLTTKNFTQPVLYGEWDVKTIAGDVGRS